MTSRDGAHEKPGIHTDTLPSKHDPHAHRPLAQRALEVLRSVKDLFAPGIETVPFDQIDEISVAQTIKGSLYNTVAATAGQDPWNPFDITDVLVSMGHVAMLRSADYQKQFPREYQTTRAALRDLQDEGVVDMRMKDAPTSHGEWNVYKVINPDLLTQVSKRARPQEPQA